MLPDAQSDLARAIIKERLMEAEAKRLNREAQRQVEQNQPARPAFGPIEWLRRLVTARREARV
jgi:hypothetical protein